MKVFPYLRAKLYFNIAGPFCTSVIALIPGQNLYVIRRTDYHAILAMPLTYLGDALRQVMIEATPLHAMNVNLLVLGGWQHVCFSL